MGARDLFHQQIQSSADVVDNKKRYLNVVLIGHVDAGKSTIGGQILNLSGQGQVDERWYIAYIMDTNEDEGGMPIEVRRAHFETETTKFTIFDAPLNYGRKSYIPYMINGASQSQVDILNMINGASQSQVDIGVLVISARKGEFEIGYETGRQTREHVELAKTLGVSKLLVVNKMDDATFNWSKERYDEILSKMAPFLKSSGYNVKKDVRFLPISGLMSYNMKTIVEKSVCPWWSGPCFFESLDTIEVPERDPNGPFRMPIIGKYKDIGTVVNGKVESGCILEGDNLLIMPNKALVKVVAIFRGEDRVVGRAGPGENLRVILSGVEEEEILPGFVLCSCAKPIHAVSEFIAHLQILELLANTILSAGCKAVLHIHSVVEDCEILELMQEIDRKTKKPLKEKPFFVRNGAFVVCRVQLKNIICIEKFSYFPQLGRFTLRMRGKTVAVGKVTRFPALGDNALDEVNT